MGGLDEHPPILSWLTKFCMPCQRIINHEAKNLNLCPHRIANRSLLKVNRAIHLERSSRCTVFALHLAARSDGIIWCRLSVMVTWKNICKPYYIPNILLKQRIKLFSVQFSSVRSKMVLVHEECTSTDRYTVLSLPSTDAASILE